MKSIIVVNLSKMGEGARGLEEGGHRHSRTLLRALPLLVINVILFPGQSNSMYMSMSAVSMSPTSTFIIASSSSTSSPSDGKQEPTT